MKYCAQTDLEFFKLIIGYFIHNDVNMMISRDGIYSTRLLNDLEMSFRLNDTIKNNPKIEMAVKDKNDDVVFVYYDFNKPLYTILYRIINDIILFAYSKCDGKIDNCWKMMRKNFEDEIED